MSVATKPDLKIADVLAWLDRETEAGRLEPAIAVNDWLNPDGAFVLRINGREYEAVDLTLDEVEEVEDLCGGVSLETVDLGRAKTLKAFVWVILKREDPTVTMEDVGNLKFKGLVGTKGQPLADRA